MRGFGPMVLAVVAAAGLVVAPPGAAAAQAAPAIQASRDGRYSAVVRRTEYGIPHVLAADFGGLGYG